jgi:hypothetical protein
LLGALRSCALANFFGVAMTCKSCASGKQEYFSGELSVAFLPIEKLQLGLVHIIQKIAGSVRRALANVGSRSVARNFFSTQYVHVVFHATSPVSPTHRSDHLTRSVRRRTASFKSPYRTSSGNLACCLAKETEILGAKHNLLCEARLSLWEPDPQTLE